MDKKLIRLTEGDLHRIVKESVERILTEMDEVAGYKQTYNKINKNLNPKTFRGKIGRMFNPQKAKQADRVLRKAENMGDEAGHKLSRETFTWDPSDFGEYNEYRASGKAPECMKPRYDYLATLQDTEKKYNKPAGRPYGQQYMDGYWLDDKYLQDYLGGKYRR